MNPGAGFDNLSTPANSAASAGQVKDLVSRYLMGTNTAEKGISLVKIHMTGDLFKDLIAYFFKGQTVFPEDLKHYLPAGII